MTDRDAEPGTAGLEPEPDPSAGAAGDRAAGAAVPQPRYGAGVCGRVRRRSTDECV